MLRAKGLGYGRGTQARPLRERFDAAIDKSGQNGCWLWLGSRTGRRYGSIAPEGGGTSILAHRAAWMLHKGQIPVGVKVCHRCDNTACVNPDHLFLGTQGDNVRDMHAKGRAHRPIGSLSAKAKITEAQAREIKRRIAAGERRKDIANTLGVSKHIVHDIGRNKTWTHV